MEIGAWLVGYSGEGSRTRHDREVTRAEIAGNGCLMAVDFREKGVYS